MINMYDVGLMPSFCAAFNKMAGNPYMETTEERFQDCENSWRILKLETRLSKNLILFLRAILPANQDVVLNIIGFS